MNSHIRKSTADNQSENICEHPIFIVGSGRSGTTLLRSLLSDHPHITIAPETHFMAWAEQWGLEQEKPKDFDDFWSHYTQSIWFNDLGIDAEVCRMRIKAGTGSSFAGILRAILGQYAAQQNKPRVGEKTPGHSRFLSILLRWFPDAQVLVTQRDPRAVIASQLGTPYVGKRIKSPSFRNGFMTNSRLEQVIWHIENWLEVYGPRLDPFQGNDRFHRVIYERLVNAPESTLKAICRFLDEPYDPDLISKRQHLLSQPSTPVSDDEELDRWRGEHQSQVLGAISTGSLDKWKRRLTTFELKMIEGCCGDRMLAMGYPLTCSLPQRQFGRLFALLFSSAIRVERAGRNCVQFGLSKASFVKPALQDTIFRLSTYIRYKTLSLRRKIEQYPKTETFRQFCERTGKDSHTHCTVIHSDSSASNPLPINVPSRLQLPSNAGWWGFSFRDVPSRISGETMLATIPHCRLLFFRDNKDDFHPAILTDDGHSLELREIRFRPSHARVLRRGGAPVRLKRATWIIERVYHNHSHWLTAHLPKLLLLKKMGRLDDVLLPVERTSVMDESMRMIGIEPSDFRQFETDRILDIDELSVLTTDRFRPELLQMVPAAFRVQEAGPPHRRIYISRERATRRKLVTEAEIWKILQQSGFEKVLMEELTFAQQVDLMRETAILVAPHGAGLTNMMFCPKGAIVVEIADLGFPNPNFYALASALGHRYCIVEAKSLGFAHPLERDMIAEPREISSVLQDLERDMQPWKKEPVEIH